MKSDEFDYKNDEKVFKMDIIKRIEQAGAFKSELDEYITYLNNGGIVATKQLTVSTGPYNIYETLVCAPVFGIKKIYYTQSCSKSESINNHKEAVGLYKNYSCSDIKCYKFDRSAQKQNNK